MRGTKERLLVLPAIGLLLLAASCTSDTLDDGDSANVVLLVDTIQHPPVVGAFNEERGICVITVTDWGATLRNEPKNALAVTSPYNDIVVQNVTISYDWDDGRFLAPRVLNASGTVPAAGTNEVTFPPVAFGDIDGSFIGHTASVTLVFRGRTVDGEAVVSPPFVGGSALMVGGDCIGVGP